MDECGYYVDTPWTWRERLWFRLFPTQHCDLPSAPAHYKDVVECTTVVHVSWLDRIRVVLLGRMTVRTRTVTENTVGGTVTSSVAFVR